jgi:hypothetical protein
LNIISIKLANHQTGCDRSIYTYEPKLILDRHLVVTEIALFIRGCVIGADEITRPSFAIRNSNRTKQALAQALIVDGLLKWKDKCAVCDEAIPLSTTAQVSVSVGLKDARVGNHITRSTLSENRKDIYKCFSEVMLPPMGTYYWHDMNGLMFHYFAKLYHRGCKWFREKETALA